MPSLAKQGNKQQYQKTGYGWRMQEGKIVTGMDGACKLRPMSVQKRAALAALLCSATSTGDDDTR